STPSFLRRWTWPTHCPTESSSNSRPRLDHFVPPTLIWSVRLAAELQQPVHIAVLSASLRHGSLNERLAELAAKVIHEKGATVERAILREFDCPSYDFDVEQESGVPEPAARFCRWLESTNAFVISSPEYNASVPGALKNLIDWASRV